MAWIRGGHRPLGRGRAVAQLRRNPGRSWVTFDLLPALLWRKGQHTICVKPQPVLYQRLEGQPRRRGIECSHRWFYRRPERPAIGPGSTSHFNEHRLFLHRASLFPDPQSSPRGPRACRRGTPCLESELPGSDEQRQCDEDRNALEECQFGAAAGDQELRRLRPSEGSIPLNRSHPAGCGIRSRGSPSCDGTSIQRSVANDGQSWLTVSTFGDVLSVWGVSTRRSVSKQPDTATSNTAFPIDQQMARCGPNP